MWINSSLGESRCKNKSGLSSGVVFLVKCPTMTSVRRVLHSNAYDPVKRRTEMEQQPLGFDSLTRWRAKRIALLQDVFLQKGVLWSMWLPITRFAQRWGRTSWVWLWIPHTTGFCIRSLVLSDFWILNRVFTSPEPNSQFWGHSQSYSIEQACSDILLD